MIEDIFYVDANAAIAVSDAHKKFLSKCTELSMKPLAENTFGVLMQTVFAGQITKKKKQERGKARQCMFIRIFFFTFITVHIEFILQVMLHILLPYNPH